MIGLFRGAAELAGPLFAGPVADEGDDAPAGPPSNFPVAALSWADDLEVAEESLNRAVAEAERRGDVSAVATASFRRAVVAYLQGSLAGAVTRVFGPEGVRGPGRKA